MATRTLRLKNIKTGAILEVVDSGLDAEDVVEAGPAWCDVHRCTTRLGRSFEVKADGCVDGDGARHYVVAGDVESAEQGWDAGNGCRLCGLAHWTSAEVMDAARMIDGTLPEPTRYDFLDRLRLTFSPDVTVGFNNSTERTPATSTDLPPGCRELGPIRRALLRSAHFGRVLLTSGEWFDVIAELGLERPAVITEPNGDGIDPVEQRACEILRRTGGGQWWPAPQMVGCYVDVGDDFKSWADGTRAA